ncbi:recombinase family protein [Streptomyces sp. NPDC004685]
MRGTTDVRSGEFGYGHQDLISVVAELRRRGIGFQSLHESLDTTTSSERPVFHVFATLAKFIRELITQGTREGLAAAPALSGTDRPPRRPMTENQVSHARGLLTDSENTIASIANVPSQPI